MPDQFEKKFVCDICNSRFRAPTALGCHKRQAHGILGSSRSTMKARQKLLDQLNKVDAQLTNPASKGAVTKNDKSQDPTRELENHISYAFGYVRCWLEIYAGSSGIPGAELTNRVAGLLQRTTRR